MTMGRRSGYGFVAETPNPKILSIPDAPRTVANAGLRESPAPPAAAGPPRRAIRLAGSARLAETVDRRWGTSALAGLPAPSPAFPRPRPPTGAPAPDAPTAG